MQIDHIDRCGLNEGVFAHMSFETFQIRSDSQRVALLKSKEVVAQWIAGDWSAGALLHSSSPGLGKTHLAVSMLRAAVRLYPAQVGDVVAYHWNLSAYLQAIKSTWDRGYGRTEDVIQSAQFPKVLVLDDVGLEAVTKVEWYQQVLYDVMEARWRHSLSTIMTTNVEPKHLLNRIGKRAMDRLLASARVTIRLEGENSGRL